MKLGIGSYTYTWACGVPGHLPARVLSPLDLCRRATELGVKVVQLCENVATVEGDHYEAMLYANAHGIEIELGVRGMAAETFLDLSPLMAMYDARFFRLVVDVRGMEPTPEEVIRGLRLWLKHLCGPPKTYGFRHKVSIALENHDRFSALTLVRIIEEVGPDRVGITLDTVNSFGALEGPEHVVKTLAPYVLSLHVKDFTIRRVPSQMGFVIEGCPAGEGRLDIPWLLNTIREAGRDPNAIIELWTPPADTLEKTIAREADWAERSVKYMRTLLPD
jgi:hypothetical protein